MKKFATNDNNYDNDHTLSANYAAYFKLNGGS